MSLIYITGLSGSGKSTICIELKKRGFEAHDADGEGFNSWYETNTKRLASKEDINKPHSRDWHQKFSWRTSEEKVKNLALKAKDRLIFLCGVSANEEEVWHLFDKVICLVANEKTIRKRLRTRTTNDFGKDTHELEMVLEWHKTYPGDYLKSGAIIVNVDQPLNKVISDILRIVG